VDGAGAAAVAGVPVAVALVALAGAQVGWEQVTACVSCEVGEGGRAGGACGDLSAAVRALAAYEDEPAGVRAQFHGPGAWCRRACCAQPHGRVFLLMRARRFRRGLWGGGPP
jgi:hypothetical protein